MQGCSAGLVIWKVSLKVLRSRKLVASKIMKRIKRVLLVGV